MGLILGLSIGLTIKQQSEPEADRLIRLKTKCAIFENLFYTNEAKVSVAEFHQYSEDKVESAILENKLKSERK